jgi:hypothetical protein
MQPGIPGMDGSGCHRPANETDQQAQSDEPHQRQSR